MIASPSGTSIPRNDDDDFSIPTVSMLEKKKLQATTKLSIVLDTELSEDTSREDQQSRGNLYGELNR